MDSYFKTVGLSKRFDNTVALDDINLTFDMNQVVGLIGENGDGKSTFLKIVAGIERSDKGYFIFKGKQISPKSYSDAVSMGITMVFQEQALVPNLLVYENLFLANEYLFEKFKVLQKREMIRKAEEVFASVGLEYINPKKVTSSYSFHTRQMIEIARAMNIPQILGIENPLVLLDEPTASLNHNEVDTLFEKVNILKKTATVVFVSHRLDEVKSISDSILVLKDGCLIDRVKPDLDENEIHKLMVGRDRDVKFYRENEQREDLSKEIMSVKNLSRKNDFENVSFELREGEILGIGGVLGCGKSELGKCLLGFTRSDSGSISYLGKEKNYRSVNESIKQGIGYVPAERHRESIILSMSVKWNMTLSKINKLYTKFLAILDLKKEKREVRRFVEDLNIKLRNIRDPISQLSGGNQQKVVIGKWLFADLKMLILDNPTRGVDVGAKYEIYTILRELVKKSNMSIILITDDLLELIGMSNRILIMKDKKVVKTIKSNIEDKPSENEVVKYMV